MALPWEGVVLSTMALDPSGTIMNSDVSTAFRDGVLLLSSAQVTVKPFGLVGHQSLAGMWSNKEHFSLDQDPSNIARFLLFEKFPKLGDPGPRLEKILARFFPGLLLPTEPLNQRSDTEALFYSFDQYLWQPKDDPKRGFGVFFAFGVSDGNPCPIQYTYTVGVGGNGVIPGRPDDSFGVGWARVEFIINPGLQKTLGSDNRLHNVDTAVVAGLRIYSRF